MITLGTKQRFFLVHVSPQREYLDKIKLELAETYALISALPQTEVVDMIMQREDRPHQTTYIGSGKAGEIARRIKEEKIDAVVINSIIKPRQVFALQKIFRESNNNIKVWDRVELILNIFQAHAQTAEAKLQIRLAQMGHMGPRIYGMGKVLSQQGGGIGSSGIGETNTELMKRHWRQEMKKVRDELDKLLKNHNDQLKRRSKSGVKTVSIIGYTNAGKSTLFNLLTGKQTLVENALFATLDSHVGKMFVKALQSELIITDTIGFMRKLPVSLIEAFRSTLLESMHADVLLHVIDASDAEMEKKIFIVNTILKELGAGRKVQMYIFNKIDKADSLARKTLEEKYTPYHPIFISATDRSSLSIVSDAISQLLNQNQTG